MLLMELVVIRELINMSENLKAKSCSIFFNDPNLSIDDIIIDQRPKLTEINVSDLILGTPDIDPTVQIVEPWWYGPFRMLIRNDFQSNSVMRMNIDVNMMYAYKITIQDICRKIEDGRSSVICVYSPMNIGEIHIYPVEKEIAKPIAKAEAVVDEANASMIFLWNIVIPMLDNIKISGVTGVAQIYPVEAPVLQIIKEEKPVGPSNPNMWYLILNPVRMMITGIRKEKLITLATVCGLEIVPKDRPTYIVVKVPGNETPIEIMNRIINEDKEDEKEYEQERREAMKTDPTIRTIRRTPTEIMTASNLIYADTDGSLFKGSKSTLRTLLANHSVDSTRTFCNNVHEIKEVLGIEAARSFMIKEFSDVIGNEGGYINPRNIVLLVDFMVSLGELNGITFSGISRQPIGALEKASFQNAMPTFAEASAFGEIKSVKGTSASIYVGKKAEIGTGFSDSYMDKTKFKRIEEEIDQNPGMELDNLNEFQDAIANIGDLNNITLGDDFMVMEGAEDAMFAGDGPMIPPAVMGNIMTGPPAFTTRTEPMRAPALNQAAGKLNQTPCLLPIKPTISTIETIDVPTPTATIPTTNIPTIGMLGLPMGIMEDMKTFQPPDTGIPIMEEPIKMGLPPAPKSDTKSPKKITFDLDTFLQ